MALLEIAARISNGTDWPDREKNEFGARDVLICATVDELQTVIRPRLRAAKANLEKCIFVENAFDEKDGKRKSRPMDLEKDTQRLYEALSSEEGKKILLVILDPVTGFYGNADPNDNRQIRKMITNIAKMCMKTRTAVACIVHENKKSDVNVVDKMMGASSLSQIIRAGMRFSVDAKVEGGNGRIMASLKNSYGKRGGGMKFKIDSVSMVSTDGRELKDIGFVVWGDPHNDTADDIREREKQDKEEGADDGKLGIAMKIIGEALKDGKRLMRDVHALLDQWERENKDTISDETRKRARRKIGALGSQGQPWCWWLPGKENFAGSAEQKMRDEEEL
jgi:hypothetical protein